jgi:4-amino-4-deoxy-L-arabinose transferase-like glycosyltransferase
LSTTVARPQASARQRAAGFLRPHARDLALLAGVTFVLRVAWVLVYGRVATGPNDTLFYRIAASNLADGRGYTELFGAPTAGWPPGFPFLMSLGYRLVGNQHKLVFVFNVALATATVVLLYLVALRMFDRRGARLAGWTFAILPGPIFFTGLYLSETLFIFLLVGFLALAMYLPDRRWTPLVLGVAIGLVALTRGEGLLMLTIPLAMWWGLARRDWLRRGALLVGAMALTIVPWTIRNAIRMDAFIPVSSNASVTLWSGHNPTANGGPTYAPPELLAAERDEDAPNPEVAHARLLRREAVKWAIRNPHKELGLIPRKLLALNGGTDRTLNVWFNAPDGERQLGTSSLIVFTRLGDGLGYFLLLATLASLLLIGPRRLWRSSAAMRAVLAYLAACLVAYGFVYYGQHRYRVPMEPFMVLVATPLILAIWAQRAALRKTVP